MGAAAILCGGFAAHAASTDPFAGGLPTIDSAAPSARDLGAGATSVGGLKGSATYSYPITVPPGRLSMQPSVVLSYSSDAPAYGGVAVGWSMGIPTISVDTSVGAGTPRFLADGRRLVATPNDTYLVYKDTANVSHSVPAYRAELDANSTRYGLYDPGSGGTKVWVAKSTDGHTRYFEKTDGLRWVLTRERDSFGNTVTYTWSTASGLEITRIDYGANTTAAIANFARVDFTYTSETCNPGALAIGAALDHGVARGSRRLLAIETSVQWESNSTWHRVRHYDLGYDAAALSCTEQNAAPARYLTSIVETGYDRNDVATTSPTITFGYGAREPDFSRMTVIEGDPYPTQGRFGNLTEGTSIVRQDVDGDGIPDQLKSVQVEVPAPTSPYHGGKDVKCGLEVTKGRPGGGLSTAAPQTWVLPTASWRNGHNPTGGERCTINGQKFRKMGTDAGCPLVSDGQVSYQLMDANGDSRPDLIVSVWTGAGYDPRFDLEQSPTSAFVPWHPLNTPGPGTDCDVVDPMVPEPGTALGTYRMRIWANNGGDFSGWLGSFSNAKWFLPPASGENALGAAELGSAAIPTLIDIDGDGFLDLVHLPVRDGTVNPPETWLPTLASSLIVLRGRGTGFSTTEMSWPKPVGTVTGAGVGWSSIPDGTDNVITSTGMTLMDVNGDGLPDLVFHDGNLKVSWNTGTGFTAAATNLGVAGPIESYYFQVNSWQYGPSGRETTNGTRTYTRRWMDVDGDHRPDIVDFPRDGVSTNPTVRFNLGTRFTAPRPMAALGPARRFFSASVGAAAPEGSWQQEGDFADWDGDGAADVVAFGGDTSLVFSNTFDRVPPRLLGSINNGRGMTQLFTYDSSNHAAAQEGPGFSTRAATWVVTALASLPGIGQPWTRTEYRYGEPRFRQHADANPADFDSEATVFAGFTLMRTTASAPNGASAGKQVLTHYALHNEDGTLEPTEVDTFANDASGLVPSSVVTTTYEVHSLMGLINVRVPKQTATRTCHAAQTTIASCKLSGDLDQTTTTWGELGIPFSVPFVAWVIAPSVSLRESSAVTPDEKRSETDYQLRYMSSSFPVDDYRLLVTSERHFRNTGTSASKVWTLSSQQDFSLNTTTGMADAVKDWTDATGAVAVTSKVWSASTGNLLSVAKPSQLAAAVPKKTVYQFSGHQVAPGITTNELGHQTIDTIDEGTGQRLARSGPNHKVFHGATITQSESFTYDGLARVVEHKRSFDDATSGYVQVAVEQNAYFDAINTIREKHRLDASAEVWKTDVTVTDGAGRPLQTTSLRNASDGTPDAVTKYQYDDAGMLAKQLVPDPTVDTGALVTYELRRDSLGRPVRLDRPNGTRVSVAYDGLAKTVSDVNTDGSGSSNRSVHDPFGRLIEIHELDNPVIGADALTRYYYDDGDRLTEVDDAEGTVTHLTYDVRGQRLSIERDGRSWTYQYDIDGNLTSELKPKPASATDAAYTSRNEYDLLGRVTKHIPASRDLVDGDRLGVGSTVYEYDSAPNGVGVAARVRQLRAAGGLDGLDYLRVEYEYAAQGGISLERRSFNASPLPAPNEGFTATQSVVRQLDALGLPTKEIWDDGQTVYTSYDLRGLPRLIEYAAVDGAARQTIADYGDRSVSGKMRQRSTGTFFGAQKRNWTFDLEGRVLTDRVTVGSATRLERSFTYFQDGNLHTINGANYDDAGQIFASAGAVFTYDKQGRISTAFGPSTYAATLGYSATGNVSQASVSGPSTVSPRNVTYDYGAIDPQAVDVLRNVADGSAFAKYDYDVAGAVIARELAPQVPMNLTWNGDGQLLKVDGPGAAKIETYHYDHDGQRAWAVNSVDGLRFWFGASETRFPPNGGEVERSINLADDSGAIGRVTKKGTAAPKVELSYSDRTLSLMMAIGATGHVEASFVYGAFGEVVAQFGQSTHRRQFNGKENDAASGLRYYGARSYDPISLRWTSADPLHLMGPEVGVGRPQAQNLYAFSNNNPNRWLDPDGHDTVDEKTRDEHTGGKSESTETEFDVLWGDQENGGVGYEENDPGDGSSTVGVMKLKDDDGDEVSALSLTTWDGKKGEGLYGNIVHGKTTFHLGDETSLVLTADMDAAAYLTTRTDEGDPGINSNFSAGVGGDMTLKHGNNSLTGGFYLGIGAQLSFGIHENKDGTHSLCTKDGVSFEVGIEVGACIDPKDVKYVGDVTGIPALSLAATAWDWILN